MDPISINPTSPIIPVGQSKSKIWLIIGIVIVLIAIAFGIYFWNNISPTDSNVGEVNELNALSIQSTSDATAAIENDLKATNLDNLDKEVPAIDSALNASVTK